MEINVNINIRHHGLEKIERVVSIINQKQNKIMSALDDVKAALATSNEKIDIILPAFEGVKKDVAYIKAKLEAAGQGSIDPAGVQELLGIASAQNDKLSQLSSDVAALDAETDSDQP